MCRVSDTGAVYVAQVQAIGPLAKLGCPRGQQLEMRAGVTPTPIPGGNAGVTRLSVPALPGRGKWTGTDAS